MNYPANRGSGSDLIEAVGAGLAGVAALALGGILIVGGIAALYSLGAVFWTLPVYAAWWLLASAGLILTGPTLFQSFALGALCMVMQGIFGGNKVAVKK